MNVKEASKQMRVYAKRKYPNETRFEDKFIELAIKM